MELVEVRDQPEALDLVGRFDIDRDLARADHLREPLARIARSVCT